MFVFGLIVGLVVAGAPLTWALFNQRKLRLLAEKAYAAMGKAEKVIGDNLGARL